MRLKVSLFRKLSVRWNEQELATLTGSKVQELFSFLLLHRDRPHARESLASLLWGDASTAQSKKYLRQALWQLQVALKCHVEPSEARTLLIDSDWVQLNSASGLWLDVAVFERAWADAKGLADESLPEATAASLQDAVDLYQGELLEGWYQEWCLYERERLQRMYLAMLDKLMGHYEAHGLFDAGLHNAILSLRHDRARECTYQRLMRLHYLAGDRAAALRQYDRCVVALDEELAVKPSQATVDLYQQIIAGGLPAPHAPLRAGMAAAPTLSEMLGRLRRLEGVLAGIQEEVRGDIQVVERALKCEGGGPGREPLAKVRSLARAATPSRLSK